MILDLPYPPSMNHYWRHVGHKVLISAKGRTYRVDIQEAVLKQRGLQRKLTGRLKVCIELHPPDRKRRDVDNAFKALLDSLTCAGVWEDDQQIDDLRIVRDDIVPKGKVIVKIERLEEF